jgi:enoyl-CoA hydratase/carnithine racemase
MTRELRVEPLSLEGTISLLSEVAGWIESACAGGAGSIEIAIHGGQKEAGPTEAIACTAPWSGPPGRAALALAAERIERSLRDLHARGGSLICASRGRVLGPFLEIALMADQHLMDEGAVLVPSGLFDGYVPCAGGWSRFIDRAGAGRAAAFLLVADRIGSRQALAAGLCDGLLPAAGRSAGTAHLERTSTTAMRLAHEIADRRARGGALTPRQARVIERASFALAFASGDPREGIAAFFEGRPARFAPQGYAPPGNHGDEGTTP